MTEKFTVLLFHRNATMPFLLKLQLVTVLKQQSQTTTFFRYVPLVGSAP